MSESPTFPSAGARPAPNGSADDRPVLRRRLIAARQSRAASAGASAAQEALAAHLQRLLVQLEPGLLGLYAPMRGEFNAIGALDGWRASKLHLALPFAQQQPRAMHYRSWHGEPLAERDECGIPAPAAGPAVVPDVVLVPCVGFTRAGLRLGYGGGYFDRWLAQHPGVTAVGVAWSADEIDAAQLAPQAHDQPMTLVLTEAGIVG